MASEHIGIRELRGNLGKVLHKVQAGGQFVILSRGKPVAELRAIAPEGVALRKAGALVGKVWMAEEFDSLPDDMLDTIDRDL